MGNHPYEKFPQGNYTGENTFIEIADARYRVWALEEKKNAKHNLDFKPFKSFFIFRIKKLIHFTLFIS